MHTPYQEGSVNILYNLLFCDQIELFKNDESKKTEPWKTLFADPIDSGRVRAIAEDEHQESRVRAVAFHQLRKAGVSVPSKILFGVIVEMPLEGGLDTLAAYADGSVRYLNHSGRVAIFESSPIEVSSVAKDLVTSSQSLVDQIGPWQNERLAPPKLGNVRISFVVSDGLYFGEAPFEVLSQDPLGGRILAKAGHLLEVVVNTATQDDAR